MIITHVPIAPWCHGKQRANVHGHVHLNSPKIYRASSTWPRYVTGRYVNLCVEHLDYRPVSLDEVAGWVKRDRELFGPLNEGEHALP